jgi:(p)ppGpp synthase/HD superfamily hydrolase
MNNNKATLEDAIAIAAQAHKDQTDKAGSVYILHPLRLMMKMKTESEMMTAILHDVVEDTRNNSEETKWTFEKLRKYGFSEEVLEALECVTNREGESYEQFIERAAANPIARRVKIADLEDNMDVKRLKTLTDKDAIRIAKYLRAWTSLSM